MTRLTGVLLLAVGLMTLGCGQVDPGERAVFVKWGTMEQKCYGPGLYPYVPIGTDMDVIDAKTKKYEVKGLAAASQDLQEIHADVVVNYAINGDRCHILIANVGFDYESKLIVPGVADALKAGTAHFPIDRIIRERAKLRDEILKTLRDRLGPQDINITDVSLTNFSFSPEFTKAIERRQIEEQRVQEAEFLRLKAVKNAEAVIAEAKGKSEANRLLAESLKSSPETIRFREIEMMREKWDGKLPQMILGGGMPLINLPNPTGK